MSSPNSRPLPAVLACLAEEHRHMSALLKLLEQRAGQKQKLKLGDYCLMRDVVGYLHDYPDEVHHPTEDLLFARLTGLRPDLAEEVQALQSQHRQMAEESTRLLEQLDRAAANPAKAPEAQIRKQAQKFSQSQSQHMQREGRMLFPAALAEFRAADWKVISRRARLHEDPLFGSKVQGRHRTLFEFLLDLDQLLPDSLAASGIDAQERLMVAVAAFERGASESLTTMLVAAGSLKSEALDLTIGKRRPKTLAGLLLTPWRYGWFMGRTGWNCGWALLGISAASTRQACGLMLEPDHRQK